MSSRAISGGNELEIERVFWYKTTSFLPLRIAFKSDPSEGRDKLKL
jgi:hypothetical protein